MDPKTVQRRLDLDWLRVLAILTVFIYHSVRFFHSEDWNVKNPTTYFAMDVLEMPVMDGYEAARQIKILQPSCQVIALSIHADEAERKQALQAGMADLIAKGAPLEMLLQAIRECGNTALEP